MTATMATRPAVRAALPKVGPGIGDVLLDAAARLSACADVVAGAGCRPAATYAAGAAGNLRRALAELAHRWPHLADAAGHDFDVVRCGVSEVFLSGGFPDTVRNCVAGDGGSVGGDADVRALTLGRSVEQCVWLRATGEVEGVHVRGRLEVTPDGCRFVEEEELERAVAPVPPQDLGRDIVASGLDLAGRATFAAALEVSLVNGSWVHLPTNSRWFADPATARAVVRLAGGCPGVDARLMARLGGCVDRGVLSYVETLGWRHWPTPSVAFFHTV